jgi:hypothetical protein
MTKDIHIITVQFDPFNGPQDCYRRRREPRLSKHCQNATTKAARGMLKPTFLVLIFALISNTSIAITAIFLFSIFCIFIISFE